MKLSLPLALAASTVLAPAARAQAPLFFDLGLGYLATDVSTAGGNVVVVGTSFNSGGAFRWTPAGGIVEIGSTTYNSAGLVRISRDGTKIVGEQDVAGVSSAAFENGTFTWTTIPGIGGSSSGTSTTCNGINSDGTVLAGLGWVNGGTAHAYRWTAAGNVDLAPFFNSPSSRAFGINGDGSIVVGWEANLAGGRRACRWQGGVRTFFTYTDPMNVVRELGEAQAINAAGTIAIGYQVLNVAGFNGWRWDSSTNQATLLPNLPGAAFNAYPTDLTDDGSIIVGSDGANVLVGGKAVIWLNNVPQSLFNYLIGLGMTGTGTYTDLGLPQAISPEGGVIVGRGLSVVAGSQPSGWVIVFPQFLPIGTPFCSGDGSGTACPCANSSPLGDQVGCLSSLGIGGKLRGTGVASISADSLTLTSTQVPNGPALYFQGDSPFAGGLGLAFGDGLLCAGGAIVRIGVKFASGNQSSYPAPGDNTLSVQGLVAPGDVRHYQAWYRDAVVGFCTVANFNLTNGLTINWTP